MGRYLYLIFLICILFPPKCDCSTLQKCRDFQDRRFSILGLRARIDIFESRNTFETRSTALPCGHQSTLRFSGENTRSTYFSDDGTYHHNYTHVYQPGSYCIQEFSAGIGISVCESTSPSFETTTHYIPQLSSNSYETATNYPAPTYVPRLNGTATRAYSVPIQKCNDFRNEGYDDFGEYYSHRVENFQARQTFEIRNNTLPCLKPTIYNILDEDGFHYFGQNGTFHTYTTVYYHGTYCISKFQRDIEIRACELSSLTYQTTTSEPYTIPYTHRAYQISTKEPRASDRAIRGTEKSSFPLQKCYDFQNQGYDSDGNYYSKNVDNFQRRNTFETRNSALPCAQASIYNILDADWPPYFGPHGTFHIAGNIFQPWSYCISKFDKNLVVTACEPSSLAVQTTTNASTLAYIPRTYETTTSPGSSVYTSVYDSSSSTQILQSSTYFVPTHEASTSAEAILLAFPVTAVIVGVSVYAYRRYRVQQAFQTAQIFI